MSQVAKRVGILTPKRCQEILKGKDKKKIAPNTVLFADVIGWRVELHGNLIIYIHPDGIQQIFDGGHRSTTTKQRLNALTFAYVSQKNYEWFVGNAKPFVNGILIAGRTIGFYINDMYKTAELLPTTPLGILADRLEELGLGYQAEIIRVFQKQNS